jgi:hypothetical protein
MPLVAVGAALVADVVAGAAIARCAPRPLRYRGWARRGGRIQPGAGLPRLGPGPFALSVAGAGMTGPTSKTASRAIEARGLGAINRVQSVFHLHQSAMMHFTDLV